MEEDSRREEVAKEWQEESSQGAQRKSSSTEKVFDGGQIRSWGDKRELPVEACSMHEGETAISPGFTTTLAASKCAAGETEALDRLGLGRVDAEKEQRVTGEPVGHVGDIYTWLEGRLDFFVDRHCKTKPTGRVYPLPTSSYCLSQVFPLCPPGPLSILRCLVVSLNSLNGEAVWNDESPTKFQKRILEELLADSRRVFEWEETVPEVTWADFFRCRGIDYKGEEIMTAQSMVWENVAPALPKEVGGVQLENVVEHGCLHYVKNFETYLLPEEDQVYTKPPRVLVPPEGWERFCRGLLELGIFDKVHEDDLYKVHGKPILNGLFGVSKGEYENQFEVMRIIMNLVPINQVCRSLEGDVATLPTWAGMTPLCLMPNENLIVSSEDVRCFFYIFKIPRQWQRFMAFNRPLPQSLRGDRPGNWYPCSAVLPMGFKNSVALAQHIHRFVIRQTLPRVPQGSEAELRKDKGFTTANPFFRIYLDNFDELKRVSKKTAQAIQGQVSPLVEGLREEYAKWGIPRHPKKGVASQLKAEVQGAIVDGSRGIAFPKPEKVVKYLALGKLLLQQNVCTQKQVQVVGGGFVYFTMFRRPLLGALNAVWRFITSFEGYPPCIKLPIPYEVKEEVARFIGLAPLAVIDVRCGISSCVTASDASSTGGGVTVSTGLTHAGCVASNCAVRGDIVEPADVTGVLTIGLFDGIGALRVAADAVGWHVLGHVSVEMSEAAQRVVESKYPQTIKVADVSEVDRAMVLEWASRFSQVGLVLIGAGPPCQGVSGLNASKKGALKDARSSLFVHVSRIRELVRSCFPWAQVRSLMESVASMSAEDESVMSADFGEDPWSIDAVGLSLARRPRLYWVDWELKEGDGARLVKTQNGRATISLEADVQPNAFLLPGWRKVSGEPFPTFTTSRPRPSPGYKPAGLAQCTPTELGRWRADQHRFPPYQYRDVFCVQDRLGNRRVPQIEEREVIMGFPRGYTMHCFAKAKQGTQEHYDARLSLVGNSWNVGVIAWLLSQLGAVLGLNPSLTVQEISQRTSPGSVKDFQSFLQRPLMSQTRMRVKGQADQLVKKLLSQVSIKGDDVLLQSSSEDHVKYHRIRATIPAKLWKWKTVCGWSWKGVTEHINVLEMRAALTALKWRIERRQCLHTKFVHLLDSLVCLHALSRGRSSSRKLRRTLLRVNALLLATKSQAVWTYVHTKENPADAPSRHPRKRKWSHA